MMSKSRTTATKRAKIEPIYPGEILKETLEDLGMSMNQLAQALHVSANRISGIVAGERASQFDVEKARDEWESKIHSKVSPMRAA